MSNVSFQIDLFILLVDIVLAVSSSYAVWINLFHHQISKLGLDAFVLLFFSHERAGRIRKDLRLVRRMGVIMLLIAVGALNETIFMLTEKIWPLMK